MNKEFLDEYIHLEKLCNDIYGTNHGISVYMYIEDMEATSNVTQNKIPLWENTCLIDGWTDIKSARNAIKSGFRPAWAQMTVKHLDMINEMNGIK